MPLSYKKHLFVPQKDTEILQRVVLRYSIESLFSLKTAFYSVFQHCHILQLWTL